MVNGFSAPGELFVHLKSLGLSAGIKKTLDSAESRGLGHVDTHTHTTTYQHTHTHKYEVNLKK